MNALEMIAVKAQKIKPLYDFLREKLGIEDILVSGNLVKIFDAEDKDILVFAKNLPNFKRLSEDQWEDLLKKIQLVEQ